jgi:hypothetical protein
MGVRTQSAEQRVSEANAYSRQLMLPDTLASHLPAVELKIHSGGLKVLVSAEKGNVR